MFSKIIQPRFAETDALGHINNAVLPVWFETGRTPVFELFVPDLDIGRWTLILARIEVEFTAELFYGRDVEIRTWVSRIGTSSCSIYQEAWQDQRLGASGTAVLVHFDHDRKQSMPIPESIRQQLSMHLCPD
jgi:acyl-CoA thioester hydrolase